MESLQPDVVFSVGVYTFALNINHCIALRSVATFFLVLRSLYKLGRLLRRTTSGCWDSINNGTKTQYLRQEKILTGKIFVSYNKTTETSSEPYQTILSTVLQDNSIVPDHTIIRPLLRFNNKTCTLTSPVNMLHPIAPKQPDGNGTYICKVANTNIHF